MDNLLEIVEGLLIEPSRKLVPILENGHSERSSPYDIPDLSDYAFDESNILCGATTTLAFDHMSELDPRHADDGAPEKIIDDFKKKYQSYVQVLSQHFQEPQLTGSLNENHWGLEVASEIDNLRFEGTTDFSLWVRGAYEKKNVYLVNTFDIGDAEYTAQIWLYCGLGQPEPVTVNDLSWWQPAESGNRLTAIKAYNAENSCGMSEAKKHVGIYISEQENQR
jgi:hypothetical protein